MILRRLVENLKQQHWTGVFIELAIVVLGVFIGMQVSNWNQQRSTDQQSELFTERLRADLRMEAWSYEYMIHYFGEVQTNAEKALAVLEGRSQASNEQLLISAYRATQFNTPTRRRAAYDEMTATGNINLIKDKSLRDAASLVYGPIYVLVDQQALGSRFREEFRMKIPVDVQSALGDKCGDFFVPLGDYKQIVGSIDYPCTTGLKQDAIDNAASILRSDDAFVPMLRLRIADLKTVSSSLLIINQDTRQALKLAVGARP
jgi:hypothetical protein